MDAAVSHYLVRENTEASRFEIMDGERLLGFAEYRPAGDAILMPHTEVDESLEGRGVGSRLIRESLNSIRARGLQVVPMCPFVAAYIKRHRDEYAALVHPLHRRALGID